MPAAAVDLIATYHGTAAAAAAAAALNLIALDHATVAGGGSVESHSGASCRGMDSRFKVRPRVKLKTFFRVIVNGKDRHYRRTGAAGCYVSESAAAVVVVVVVVVVVAVVASAVAGCERQLGRLLPDLFVPAASRTQRTIST